MQYAVCITQYLVSSMPARQCPDSSGRRRVSMLLSHPYSSVRFQCKSVVMYRASSIEHQASSIEDQASNPLSILHKK